MHLIIYVCLLVGLVLVGDAWRPDVIPKLYIKYDPELSMFYGNLTDYFKILDQDESTILIGARNNVYNISLSNLLENKNQRIEWVSSDAHRELCALKGKQETDCQNYIRVYARISDSQIMVCGTNSYKPLCRYYTTSPLSTAAIATNLDNTDVLSSENSVTQLTHNENFHLEMINEIEAQGRCPYNPAHNSTYVFTDGQLYSATVADFAGADPLIYREPQRTEQYDLKQLNQPAFVSALERNGYVFFFFREVAMEYVNCGKAIYSRVGRVCKNDKGGPNKFGDRWTSFLKTRLNCSMPGEYPFYFDEIQATSKIIEMTHNAPQHSIVYAVFTTPPNSIPGSAICAFSVDDIMDSFEGRFKSQRDSSSNWLPIPPESVPEPRPGKCVDDSRTLPSMAVNFVKTHTLMEQAVPSLFGRPILTRVNLKHRFTAITVDPQIRAMDGHIYDVIFVGTDDGRVIKFITLMTPTNSSTNHNNDKSSNGDDDDVDDAIVITETQALPHGIDIKELSVSRETESLIVVGNGHIVSIPLNYCSKIVLCRDCFNLRDPYCVWDVNNHECTSYAKYHQHHDSDGNKIVTPNMCKKYAGNRLEPPPIVIQSTRGTVSSVGRVPHNTNFGNDNEITVTSINGDDLSNQINKHVVDPLVKEHLGSNSNHGSDGSNSFQMANSSIIVMMCILFLAGITFGFLISKLKVRFSPCYNEHRNQIASYGQKRHLQPLNSGKDINLLMDTTFPSTCNNKKDNLEQEFAKDRSHECKNSTENLDKDPTVKGTNSNNGNTNNTGTTSTQQKVKKTYL